MAWMIGGFCIDFMKNYCFIVLTVIHFVHEISMIIISKQLITMYWNIFYIEYGFILLIADSFLLTFITFYISDHIQNKLQYELFY